MPPDAVNGVAGTATDIAAGGDHTLAIALPEPTAWLAQLSGLGLLCALHRSRVRKRRGRALCYQAKLASRTMSDKKITAMSPDVLRSSPPGGGLIRLLSALICIALFVFGSARISYATDFYETQIVAHDAAAGDQFGIAVSLSGETIVIGAPFDDDAGPASGSAYVFQREVGGGDGWGQVKKLTADDAAEGDRFGYTVAISGNTVVVGAPADDDAGSESGGAYVFERDAGSPTFLFCSDKS
jgi:hypothetical protein